MTNQNTLTTLPVNRTYKSTVFIMLFEDRDNLPEHQILKLSDMYNIKGREVKLELEAVEYAIRECIAEGVLKDFLEKHMQQEREDAWKGGLLQGKASAVINLLKELSPLPEALEQKIKDETNPDILDKWIRLAAKAGSLDDFEKDM